MKFADDVSLVSWSPTPTDLFDEVKKEVKKFEDWLGERQMIFEPTKSKFMLFSRTLATTKKYFSELGIELVN